jgi:glycosyltransferase involved in cell wall biosynthesis
MGNRYTLYVHAFFYYLKRLRSWPDVVIDEVNTLPFFAKFYVKQKNLLFVHQLCREIWFYQMPFPVSIVGYIIEPIYLWLLRDREVITVSESTRTDLLRYGFNPQKIHIISEGIEMEPILSLDMVTKYDEPTILAFGTIRSMKRTLDTVRAFELLKTKIPNAKLIVAGRMQEKYGKDTVAYIERSPYRSSIELHTGFISAKDREDFMRRAQVIAYPSIKEGWGLMATEANSQGTPAAVYNADGLRDSVKNDVTGVIATVNTPQGLADALEKILTLPPHSYEAMRRTGWEWSKEITFERSHTDFSRILGANS